MSEEINPKAIEFRAKMVTMKAAYLNGKITYEQLAETAQEYINYMSEVRKSNPKLRKMRLPSIQEVIRKF